MVASRCGFGGGLTGETTRGRMRRMARTTCLTLGSRREAAFHEADDFEALERLIVEALERSPIKLLAYCLLPNRWHLVVSPEVDGKMGRFGPWLGLTHTQRYHVHNHTAGDGHRVQDRFRSFPAQDDDHFLAVCW